MLILVRGKNNSGKSAFAEKLAVRLSDKRFYIATMQPYGKDGAKRVEKHRAQRAGLHFETLERPYAVSDAPVCCSSVVLLEDVSNLLANVLFEKGKNERQVHADILLLASRCKALIAVTISKIKPGEYDGETIAYIAALQKLNERLYDSADIVYEMQNGVAVLKKGIDDELVKCTVHCGWDV